MRLDCDWIESSLLAVVLQLGERSRDLDLEVRWLLRGPPTRRSAELLERWEIAICACRDRGFPLRALECGLKLEAGDQSCLRLHLHADGARDQSWQLDGRVGGEPHADGARNQSWRVGGGPLADGAGAAVSAAATIAAVSAAATSAAASAALVLAFLLTHVRYGHSAALAVPLTPVQVALLRDRPPTVRAHYNAPLPTALLRDRPPTVRALGGQSRPACKCSLQRPTPHSPAA